MWEYLIKTSTDVNPMFQERMAGAKLMGSLMASDDAVIESFSVGLLEARSILLHISTSDPSPQLRQVCQKLLACLTSQ